MCNKPNCDTLVVFRRPYARQVEKVRCSELGPEDRARYGCEAYCSASVERLRDSARSSWKTLVSKVLSVPLSRDRVLTITAAVCKRS